LFSISIAIGQFSSNWPGWSSRTVISTHQTEDIQDIQRPLTKRQNQDRTGSDRIGLDRIGSDRTDKTWIGSDQTHKTWTGRILLNKPISTY